MATFASLFVGCEAQGRAGDDLDGQVVALETEVLLRYLVYDPATSAVLPWTRAAIGS